MKRSLLGIFLIFCLLSPFLGNYLIIRQQISSLRHEVRREMYRDVHKGDLLTLRIHRGDMSSIEWKGDDEFSYGGEMYDIVHSEVDGDFIVYQCWPDKRESQLNKKLQAALSMVMEDHQPIKHQKDQMFKLFKKLFQFEKLITLPGNVAFSVRHWIPMTVRFSSRMPDALYHPPR